jgi:hypothetical protein
MTTTRTKPRIIPEAVALYRRARELYDAPIPADPARRIMQNRRKLTGGWGARGQTRDVGSSR